MADWVAEVEECKEHSETFRREKIDGSSLVLLTESHLTSLGLKLGPAIKLRSADKGNYSIDC